jgi:hypothetical protein
MKRNTNSGQTLVESLMALMLLFMLFFFIYYIFLMGLDKIRSLDTVYNLARIQEVQPDDAQFLGKAPLAILQCFGRPGFPQFHSMSGSVTPIGEISFQFLHNFSPLLPLPHKSVMRVAQPDRNYLIKSYLHAGDDIGGSGLLPKLEAENLELQARAHLNGDSAFDLADDWEASSEAGTP